MNVLEKNDYVFDERVQNLKSKNTYKSNIQHNIANDTVIPILKAINFDLPIKSAF